MATTFECDEKFYDLRLDLRACKAFEKIRGKSPVDAVTQSTNQMMVSDIEAFLAVGLFYADGGRISPAQASQLADKIIEEVGAPSLTIIIIEAIERDCAFLLNAPDNVDTIG